MMRCEDCGYYWQEEEDRYPCCHFYSQGWFDPAPCEIEENESYDDGPSDEEIMEQFYEYVEFADCELAD